MMPSRHAGFSRCWAHVRPLLQWTAAAVSGAFLALLPAYNRAEAAAQEQTAQAWLGVSRVRGQAIIEYRSGRNDRDQHRHFIVEDSTDVQVDFVLERTGRVTSDHVSWRAVSAMIRGQSFGRTDHAYPWHQVRFTTRADFRSEPLSLPDMHLELNPESGVWQLVSPGRLRDKYRVVTSGMDRNTGTNQIDIIEQVEEIDQVDASIIFDGTLAGKPAAVNGRAKVESRGTRDNPTGWSATVGRISFWPEYTDVEVEVTIDGYADWRPKGSIADPTKPGNGLVARAVLKSRDGKTKDLPEVERFRFELLDTSREPGICLNWPLHAQDEDYDMRLADFVGDSQTDRLTAAKEFMSNWGLRSMGDYDLASMPPGGAPAWSFPEVSANGQHGEFPDPPKDANGQPFAEAAIECFDFGAKSELRVTCVLKDGREIVGLLKGADGEQDLVRLPKRAGPDWIAESWRKKNDVLNLAAKDDDEKVDGQPDNGDGFTLYEEYRGWVENGKHLEGDPKAKDFFVLNGIGADAIGGFNLFARESRLKVHHRLTKREMSTETRLLNGNHRDAPHRVAQHGVWIYNAAGTGIPDAGTTGTSSEAARYAFRPGRVRYITVEPRNIHDATFATAAGVKLYNLTERDAAFGYDRAVAHELLHAVGVDHHGEGESAGGYYFQSASDPNNASHRVGFTRTLPHRSEIDLRKGPGYQYTGTELNRTPPVTFLWEDTRRNVAEELAPIYERKLAAERARRAANPPAGADDPGRWATEFPVYGRSAEYWRESAMFDSVAYHGSEFELLVTIGKRGEADSGDEGCLMRYYFANAYPVDGHKGAYYLVRPGANRAGRSICRAPAGTGANAPSHQPQPRFGDCSPGRGNCFSQICPNDAIPPRQL